MKQLTKQTYSAGTGVSKKNSVGHFLVAIAVIIVLASMSYTAFITVIGVGGKTNFYLALPSIVTVLAILLSAVYMAVRSK